MVEHVIIPASRALVVYPSHGSKDMDVQKPLRVAIVGTSTNVRGLVRRNGEFESFLVTTEFPTVDDYESSLADWLSSDPTNEADAICYVEEQACSVTLAKQCITQGLHVWCAGPLTSNITLLTAIQAQAREANVTLVCGGTTRYTNSARLAENALSNGELGRPVCLRALELSAKPEAGWPLAELMALASAFFDDLPSSVYAQTVGKQHLSVSLSYPGGATALLALGAAPGSPQLSELMLLGDRGAFYDTMAPTAVLMLPAKGGAADVYSEDDASQPLGGWLDQCAQSVMTSAPPPVTESLACEIANLIDHVELAVRVGAPVMVNSVERTNE